MVCAAYGGALICGGAHSLAPGRSFCERLQGRYGLSLARMLSSLLALLVLQEQPAEATMIHYWQGEVLLPNSTGDGGGTLVLPGFAPPGV